MIQELSACNNKRSNDLIIHLNAVTKTDAALCENGDEGIYGKLREDATTSLCSLILNLSQISMENTDHYAFQKVYFRAPIPFCRSSKTFSKGQLNRRRFTHLITAGKVFQYENNIFFNSSVCVTGK